MSDMYKWVFRPEISKDKALLKLLIEPYCDMVLILGPIDLIPDGNFRFKYFVVDNPNGVDYSENIEFHKYLERIIEELLRVKRNELESKIT